MVSKKNYNGRTFAYKNKATGVQFNSNQMFFNASQIPDNPGYMDFNNMDDFNAPILNNPLPNNAQLDIDSQKRKSQKNKQKNKQNPQQQHSGHQNNAWVKNKVPQQQQFGQGVGPNNSFRHNIQQRGFPQGNRSHMLMRGNGRMMPPNGIGMRRPPPPPHGFQRPPMMPPMMGPMMRPPPPPIVGMPPNTQFQRRNGRRHPNNINGSPFKKPLYPPPMNLPMPPMMPPGPLPMPRMPLPYNNTMGPNTGKIKKPNPKMVKKIVKNKSTIKTLKNLQNQYPLDKPWVTEEIRTEHGKKVEIEDQLKGKKDDELFAQFKTQRDKFVALYETAREEYLKKEAAQVKTKDANGRQTNSKAAVKNGKNNEKIPISNTNANTNA